MDPDHSLLLPYRISDVEVFDYQLAGLRTEFIPPSFYTPPSKCYQSEVLGMIKTSLMRNHVLYDDLLIKKGGGQAASDLSSIKTFKFLLKLFTLTGLDIGVPGGMPPFLRFLKCPGMQHRRPLLESFFRCGSKMHRYKIHV